MSVTPTPPAPYCTKEQELKWKTISDVVHNAYLVTFVPLSLVIGRYRLDAWKNNFVLFQVFPVKPQLFVCTASSVSCYFVFLQLKSASVQESNAHSIIWKCCSFPHVLLVSAKVLGLRAQPAYLLTHYLCLL